MVSKVIMVVVPPFTLFTIRLIIDTIRLVLSGGINHAAVSHRRRVDRNWVVDLGKRVVDAPRVERRMRLRSRDAVRIKICASSPLRFAQRDANINPPQLYAVTPYLAGGLPLQGIRI